MDIVKGTGSQSAREVISEKSPKCPITYETMAAMHDYTINKEFHKKMHTCLPSRRICKAFGFDPMGTLVNRELWTDFRLTRKGHQGLHRTRYELKYSNTTNLSRAETVQLFSQRNIPYSGRLAIFPFFRGSHILNGLQSWTKLLGQSGPVPHFQHVLPTTPYSMLRKWRARFFFGAQLLCTFNSNIEVGSGDLPHIIG